MLSEGIRQLRHDYASVVLAGGVSSTELAEYLGHADHAFTRRANAHLLPSSHDRARAVINEHFTRLSGAPGSLTLKRQAAASSPGSDGAETEQSLNAEHSNGSPGEPGDP